MPLFKASVFGMIFFKYISDAIVEQENVLQMLSVQSPTTPSLMPQRNILSTGSQ